MKKHNLIIVITIILASIITYQTLTLAEKFDPDERKVSGDVNLPEYLTLDFEVETYNSSSHVFIAEVTRKEARKVGDNGSNITFTYVTVQVERYDKGEGENEVVVRYEGGTVDNITASEVYYSPHGTVSLIIGQKAIFFTNKVEGKENLYYTYYVKKTHS